MKLPGCTHELCVMCARAWCRRRQTFPCPFCRHPYDAFDLGIFYNSFEVLSEDYSVTYVNNIRQSELRKKVLSARELASIEDSYEIMRRATKVRRRALDKWL